MTELEMSKDDIKEYWMENWPKEVPRHIDYEEISLGQMLENIVNQYPDSQAIFFEGFRMTYKELMMAVDQFATGLSKLGVEKDDVVLIDLPNLPQFIIAFYACARIGAISNPIIPLNKYTEILHQANDSKGKVLIILDALFEEYLHGKDLSKMKDLEHIIFTGVAEYLPKIKAKLGTLLGKVPRWKNWPEKVGNIKCHKFQELLKSGTPIDVPKVKINPKDDVATLIYTGGTTGAPKGVQLSHYNLVVNAEQGNTWARKQLPELEDTLGKGGMVVVLPLAHLFALSIGMNIGIANGYKLILFAQPPRENLSKILAAIMKEKATFIPGVPTLWQGINMHPKSPSYKGKLESFVACLSGAAPLPAEVKEKFEDITGSLIIEGFGMSETSPILTVTPFPPLYRKNTVGFPVSDTLIKIVDIDTGEKILPQCPHKEPYCTDSCGIEEAEKYIGEICGNGPQVMLGYLNRPEANKRALRKDSKGRTWYYTADIGCIDCEGCLRIKDRKRDMIKYKGHSVFPREVEDLFYLNEAVAEVGVVGVKDPEVGENIKAFVSLKEEYIGKVTEQDLLNWAKDNIAPYKYPRMIEIVNDLPKTLVGKILRRELRD
jgi:long-chain acyl-CoA synthetase